MANFGVPVLLVMAALTVGTPRGEGATAPSAVIFASDRYLTGAGGSFCARWSAAAPGSRTQLDGFQWVVGWLSANIELERDRDKTFTHQGDEIMAKLRSFCHANPTANLDDAARAIYREN